MKKQILLNASIMVLLAVVFNSCSTSYEARRYSNLNYVKAGNPKIAQPPAADLKKEEIKPIKNNADALQSSDYTASEKVVEPKQFSRKSSSTEKQSTVTNQKQVLKPISKADIKNAVKAVVKDKKIINSEASSIDMNDPGKLLLLWLIFLGGAILFYILGAAAVSSALYIVGGLLSLAAGVFFVLWIVALVNNS